MGKFQQIKKSVFNSTADGKSGSLGNIRKDIQPQQISLFDSIENRSTVKVGGGGDAKCHIYDHIISIQNLLAAWQEFLRGKRKRKDVERFSLRLTDNIIKLHHELAEKTYKHGPYRAFKINDPKPRDIHKASVRDRLLHHAIYRILYPILDPKFIFDSFSCRRTKGTHKALNRFQEYIRKSSRNNTRTTWVLKCDIKKFFASVDHEILLDILKGQIEDDDTVSLLREIISSFTTNNKLKVGLPLGNLTSQLLVNVYMNEFDHFLKRELKIKYYIRYADDFVILQENREYLQRILPQISSFLENRLKLSLHPDKVFIKTISSGVDFLGWVHFPNYRVLRVATKRRMFRKLNKNLAKEFLASYSGLLSHGNTYKLKQDLDKRYGNDS